MQKDSEKGICKICNLPKGGSKSASLTQWIMVCTCDLAGDKSEAVDICKNCGKKLSQGRKGSFTQWILRSDLCNCEVPAQMLPVPDSTDQEVTVTVATDTEIEQKQIPFEELAVDPGSFPHERFGPIEILGRSANSTVYLAIDRLLNKKVAVKCLLSLGEDREKILAFQNEARITSKMQHPNIASVLDFGVTGNATPYMILEYIDGKNLRDFLLHEETASNDGVSAEFILALFNQILEAVIYAHEKEILHRDLKPENILVTADEQGLNQIKIIDFGIAQAHKESKNSENTLLVGTPAYMAPEQAQGGHYDKRSEIYSLGCVLYEMFCGTPPYSAETSLDMLNKHALAPIPLLSDLKCRQGTGKLPEDLAEIAARCIAKEPDERFASATSLKVNLDSLNLKESTGPEVTTESSDQNWGNVFRKILGTAALVSVFGALAYFASGLISNRLTEGTGKSTAAASYIEPEFSSLTYEEKERNPGFIRGDDGYVHPKVISNLKDEDLVRLRRIPAPRLSLMHSTINGSGFKYLKGKKIVNLRLNFTDITDDNLIYLQDLKDLRILHLGGTAISARGIKNLDGIKLRHLFLYDCSYIDDHALELIAKQFPELRKLSLGCDTITVAGLEHLKQLKYLTNLNIGVPGIDDNTIDVIASLPIRNLDLHSAHIGKIGLLKLYKAKNLRSLTIEESDSIPTEAADQARAQDPSIKLVIRERTNVNEFGKEIDTVLDF